MRRRTVQPEIRSFVSSLRSRTRHRSKTKKWELFRRVQRFWQLKVWTQRHWRGEKLRCNFLARKSAKFFANTKVHIFGKEKCKTHRQFQRYLGDVTSISLSLSLSVSLSLSPSAPHAQYRKRFRDSYNKQAFHSIARQVQYTWFIWSHRISHCFAAEKGHVGCSACSLLSHVTFDPCAVPISPFSLSPCPYRQTVF